MGVLPWLLLPTLRLRLSATSAATQACRCVCGLRNAPKDGEVAVRASNSPLRMMVEGKSVGRLLPPTVAVQAGRAGNDIFESVRLQEYLQPETVSVHLTEHCPACGTASVCMLWGMLTGERVSEGK